MWDGNTSDSQFLVAAQNLLAMESARQAVWPSLSMATCGWVLGPAGNRTYFDTVLPADWSMSSIDMDVGKYGHTCSPAPFPPPPSSFALPPTHPPARPLPPPEPLSPNVHVSLASCHGTWSLRWGSRCTWWVWPV